MKKKVTTKQEGGIKVTLTKDYVTENGQVIKAGKTPVVSRDLHRELKEGGFLDNEEKDN